MGLSPSVRKGRLALPALVMMVACGPPRAEVRLSFGGGSLDTVPGVDGCDDFGTSPVDLDPGEPLTVLVHGCVASSGRLRTLAAVFESRGQQTVCFSYDDRDDLDLASAQLIDALDGLVARLDGQPVTIVGHSQGGLVARRALVRGREDGRRAPPGTPLRLVTISSPLNGIAASEHCGLEYLHVLSMGVTLGVCEAVAGGKWQDIPPESDFIRLPGELSDDVASYLKVVTDERGTCRRYGRTRRCIEDDFVFSREEQYNPAVDRDPRVTNVELAVGHAAVIGAPGQPPLALVGVLEGHGVLRPALPGARAEVDRVLRCLYAAGPPTACWTMTGES